MSLFWKARSEERWSRSEERELKEVSHMVRLFTKIKTHPQSHLPSPEAHIQANGGMITKA